MDPLKISLNFGKFSLFKRFLTSQKYKYFYKTYFTLSILRMFENKKYFGTFSFIGTSVVCVYILRMIKIQFYRL